MFHFLFSIDLTFLPRFVHSCRQGISIEELRTSSITKSKAASVPLPESQSLITRISEKREQDKSSPNQPLRERKDNSPVKVRYVFVNSVSIIF